MCACASVRIHVYKHGCTHATTHVAVRGQHQFVDLHLSLCLSQGLFVVFSLVCATLAHELLGSLLSMPPHRIAGIIDF